VLQGLQRQMAKMRLANKYHTSITSFFGTHFVNMQTFVSLVVRLMWVSAPREASP
jgi:hypothetical protein